MLSLKKELALFLHGKRNERKGKCEISIKGYYENFGQNSI